MEKCTFLDKKGSFVLEQAENTSGLYFPIADEGGVKSALTPTLGGDSKLDQNHFLLQPVSEQDLHNNKSSRNFWCVRTESGKTKLWSATGASAQAEANRFTNKQEKSRVMAGMMWHITQREENQGSLSAKVVSFVPKRAQQVEVMEVTITNKGTDVVTFLPVAAIPLYGRSADNIRDHRHVTSLLNRIRTIEHGVLLAPTLSFDERGHQINDTGYFVCGVSQDGKAPRGFYPTVEDFIGEGGSFLNPQSLAKQMEPFPAGYEEQGREAMGAIVFDECTLHAGESQSFIVLLGCTKKEANGSSLMECTDQAAEDAIRVLGSSQKVHEAFEETKRYWENEVNIACHTADPSFDSFMQWVGFQPMLRRIYGCSFLPHHDYGKGGRGWRDLWQDCLALLIMEPRQVRQMLLDNFGGVRMDGTNATIIGSRPGEFIADRNSIVRVWMDHGVWPVITTALYIEQTGDLELLLKKAVYFKDRQAKRGSAFDEKWDETQGTLQLDEEKNVYLGTVLEHLLIQNVTAFFDVGEHGNMRLHGADWNDALDMAQDKGESVAFTAAYAENLETLSRLIRTLYETKKMTELELSDGLAALLSDETKICAIPEEKQAILDAYLETCKHSVKRKTAGVSSVKVADMLTKMAQWIKDHISKEEWIAYEDGGWFNGYYDNHARALEGVETRDGETLVKMMLTSQVFTIMSETATKEQVEKIIRSADRYLYKEEIGGYRLNTDFKEVKTDMGRMFGFAYGHKENGAVFSHMAVMYAKALYKRGFARAGAKVLSALYRQSMNFPVSRIYPGIPEYFNDRGRGMYHYLTGAASWYLYTVVSEVYGVKGALGDLCLEPKLLKEQFDEQGKAQIELTFGGYQWNVIYINPQRKDAGEYAIGQIWLDGRQLKDEVKVTGASCATIASAQFAKFDRKLRHELIVTLV